ncbi:MAG: hypothetical protein WDO73_27095 [Ignavibacteriota bacterium]
MRAQVVESLSTAASPARTDQVQRLLVQGAARQALDRVTPSELFVLARDLAPKRTGDDSCLLAELETAVRCVSARDQLRGYLARVRHTEAHARQFV